MEKRKFRSNEKGAVLITALAVLVMLSILISSILFFANVNQKKTHSNYNESQAYLTASSTLESFIAQIESDTAPTNDATQKAAQLKAIEDLENLADANGGKGTTTQVQINGNTDNTENMGTCTISVAREGSSSSNIVVTCTADYLGTTQTVAAHIATQSKNKQADYTNTLEITGSGDQSYDNLNVIGDMAVIEDSTGKIYSFTNNTSVYGSYVMQGSLKNSVNMLLCLKPSLTDKTQGTSVTVSENLVNSSNAMKIESTMVRADGYNYVNVGERFIMGGTHPRIGNYDSTSGTAYEIDVFASKAYIASDSYVQYGNFYCYKSGLSTDTAEQASKWGCAINDWSTGTTSYLGDGDAYIYKAEINGDMFVEGNLTVTGNLNVTGDIYVTGTVTGTDKIQNAATKLHTGVTLSKTGRDSRPTISAQLDDYVYYPEDFFVSTDSKVSTIRDKYLGFYNGSVTATFSSLSQNYVNTGTPVEVTSTVDGTSLTSKYCFKVTESCTFDSGMDFNKLGNGAKILVEVTDASKDIVIRLQSGLSLDSSWSPAIIVRNTSSVDSTTGEHKYNCYFVSDSGNAITLGGLDASGKSTHSGSVATSVSIQSLMVLDYETYVRMYDATVLAKEKGLSGETMKDSFVLNPTAEDVTGAYKPDNSSIVFLLGEGTTFSTTNNCLIQASIYAPQAKWNVSTSGKSVKVADSTGSYDTYGICNIGVTIAGSFANSNYSYYVYQKPSSTTMLAAAKGIKDDSAAGYQLYRYDHY